VIAGEATLVRPANRLSESPDESDNRFYECAAAAEADYIVTGNARHFNKPYRTTRIVTVRQFLTLLAPPTPAGNTGNEGWEKTENGTDAFASGQPVSDGETSRLTPVTRFPVRFPGCPVSMIRSAQPICCIIEA